MSDPNIRRWLSWINHGYLKELNSFTEGKGQSLPHLWIKTKDSSESVQNFLDLSLWHMGVKIGLIDDYQKVEEIWKKIM